MPLWSNRIGHLSSKQEYVGLSPTRGTKIMRIFERLEYDGWNEISIRQLEIGDIVRANDLPNAWYTILSPYSRHLFSHLESEVEEWGCVCWILIPLATKYLPL